MEDGLRGLPSRVARLFLRDAQLDRSLCYLRAGIMLCRGRHRHCHRRDGALSEG